MYGMSANNSAGDTHRPLKVVIIGGGLAGLAAATALAERGIACEILEARSRLGGRASSFLDGDSGQYIDNCQHVSLGCCTNFRQFCRVTGLSEFFRREKSLFFIGPDHTINRFQSLPLPAPFHLAASFVRLSYLTWSDKLSLARGLRSLSRPISDNERGIGFDQWLVRHHQNERTIERFWNVVTVSALSESPDRISVEYARKVFVDTFLSHRSGWEMEIPKVPLQELYGDTLTDWLKHRGTSIQLQSNVVGLEVAENGNRLKNVCLSTGEKIDGDEFILAVPFFRIGDVANSIRHRLPELAGIDRLETAPISSLHLWFDRPITKLPHAVLVGTLSQWIFNRSDDNYYQVVISASRELAHKQKDEILETVIGELSSIWPETKNAKLLRSKQVTEHRAVFSPLPDVDQYRPHQQSSIANLQYAGDWTKTEWPATMEGAVRSGYRAVENILTRLGRPETIVQSDLQVGRISKLLLGIS
ncbi:MAG: FAD-dependent oxidoreductase [Planctomycetes bacterium]|nr:FAD-dependent oxidoreductase [Planctomycetota bacterium]